MKYALLVGALVASFAANASEWAGMFECISNDAKKEKLSLSFLDSEIVRTRESASSPDRYYRVTDSSEELVEGAILGHKSGANARLVPVTKGTMNFTMTRLDASSITASIKVGKSVRTYTCAAGK